MALASGLDYSDLKLLQLLEQNGGYGNAVPSRGPPHPGGSSSGGYSGGECPLPCALHVPLRLPCFRGAQGTWQQETG